MIWCVSPCQKCRRRILVKYKQKSKIQRCKHSQELWSFSGAPIGARISDKYESWEEIYRVLWGERVKNLFSVHNHIHVHARSQQHSSTWRRVWVLVVTQAQSSSMLVVRNVATILVQCCHGANVAIAAILVFLVAASAGEGGCGEEVTNGDRWL